MTRIEILNGGVVKEGDTYPDLRMKMFDGDDPFNLDGYTVTVTIKRTDAESAVVDSATATAVIPNRGIVTYSWQSGDTDESGTYLVEVVADDGAGSVVTFPNDEYARVYVEDRL